MNACWPEVLNNVFSTLSLVGNLLTCIVFFLGDFDLALKNFKEASQMLEDTSYSSNHAKLYVFKSC